MKINEEFIPALPIVYMRRVGAYGKDNFMLMQAMKDWIQRKSLLNDDSTIYAIAQDNPAVVSPEKCRYDVCYVTKQVFEDSAIHVGSLSAGVYLICQIPHTAEDVQYFWGAMGEILANEKKQLDDSRPILERYQLGLVKKGYCEFCLPVMVD